MQAALNVSTGTGNLNSMNTGCQMHIVYYT